MDLELEQKAAKHSYIFPDFLSKAMAKVDLRTQFEGTMLSVSLILIGMTLTGIYLVAYVSLPLWYKIVIVINILAGIVFMLSNLITTYQQFLNYMSVLELTRKKQ